jgi:hypothetical protein
MRTGDSMLFLRGPIPPVDTKQADRSITRVQAPNGRPPGS